MVKNQFNSSMKFLPSCYGATVGIAPKSPCGEVYLSPSTLLVWMHRSMCKTESREAMSLFHRETELFKGNYQAINVFKKAFKRSGLNIK